MRSKVREKMHSRLPIWESSSRPLYPKCVWIEGGGYRHFILDHDINKKRRWNHRSKFVPSNQNRATLNAIQESVDSLKLIGCGDNVAKQRPLPSASAEARRNFSARNIKGNGTQHRTVKKAKIKDSKAQKNATTTKEETPESAEIETKPTNDLDDSKNQLTERVLQWLDLAGRDTMLRLESEGSKHASTPPRRIFTTDSLKKSPQLTQLKRSESVHHLSLTFNDDDSQNPNDTQQNPLFGGRSIPSAHHRHGAGAKSLERKQSLQQPAINKRSLLSDAFLGKFDTIDIQSSFDFASSNGGESVGSSAQRRRSDCDGIENQYRLMIRRQILENSCNTQLAKRQLHIFMPKLPKKQFGNLGATDSDSCFSSVLSKLQ